MENLASKLRPSKLSDILGNQNLVGIDGIYTNMINKKKYFNTLLYGLPGIGKTTIALAFVKATNLPYTIFNASTDKKDKLKVLAEMQSIAETQILVVDEIHRMKTDIQDYLLPIIESGKVILLGLTTINPFFSVNQAVRSRCLSYEVIAPSIADLKAATLKALKVTDEKLTISEDLLSNLPRLANYEVRSLYNILDAAISMVDEDKVITSQIISKVCNTPQLSLDNHQDRYYLLLSGLQKSIRGSDVDASLFYLANLIVLEDLEVIMRRLMVIAYEDIGLANPSMGERVLTVYDVVKKIGLPEAQIPLGVLVIDMALSPKSNTANAAIARAIEQVRSNNYLNFPDYIDNKKIAKNPSIYRYPHDDLNSVNSQAYLPQSIKDMILYYPKDETKYESMLKERLKYLDELKGKNRKH